MAQPISEVKLKLLIDTKAGRVLFGEADNNFIDFLFNLLSLPLGTAVNLLKNQSMVGSLANVYESVQSLSDTYWRPNQNKDTILNPKASICCSTMSKLLPADIIIDSSTTTTTFYLCFDSNNKAKCRNSVSDGPDAVCPACNCYMDKVGQYVQPPSIEDEGLGFVKDLVSYMVMDDLSVNPMSTISSMALLNKFNIEDLGALEEKHITLNVNEGVKLLKASLQSNTVLTDVFLGRIL